jgi:hypothetical protein
MLSCPGVLPFFVNFKTFSRSSKIIEAGYKTNTQIANELEITPIFEKLPEYKIN